jgi:hypothetical protein
MRPVVSLLAVAVLVAVAGCGSRPTRVTTPATPTGTTIPLAATPTGPTHAQFVRQLDETCGVSFTDLKRQASATDDPAILAGIMSRLVDRYQRFMRPQQHLHPPAADRPAFSRYMRAQTRMLAIYTRVRDQLRAGDISEVRYLLGALNGPRHARTVAAVDLGATRCGS